MCVCVCGCVCVCVCVCVRVCVCVCVCVCAPNCQPICFEKLHAVRCPSCYVLRVISNFRLAALEKLDDLWTYEGVRTSKTSLVVESRHKESQIISKLYLCLILT